MHFVNYGKKRFHFLKIVNFVGFCITWNVLSVKERLFAPLLFSILLCDFLTFSGSRLLPVKCVVWGSFIWAPEMIGRVVFINVLILIYRWFIWSFGHTNFRIVKEAKIVKAWDTQDVVVLLAFFMPLLVRCYALSDKPKERPMPEGSTCWCDAMHHQMNQKNDQYRMKIPVGGDACLIRRPSTISLFPTLHLHCMYCFVCLTTL